jgi:hypothetical protein
MVRSSWIPQVGSKSNKKCPVRDRRGDYIEPEEGKPCKDGGRVTQPQGTPKTIRCWRREEEGRSPRATGTVLRILASRTVRK